MIAGVGLVLGGYLLISLAIAGIFLYSIGRDKGWSEGGVSAVVVFSLLAGIGLIVKGIFGA